MKFGQNNNNFPIFFFFQRRKKSSPDNRPGKYCSVRRDLERASFLCWRPFVDGNKSNDILWRSSWANLFVHAVKEINVESWFIYFDQFIWKNIERDTNRDIETFNDSHSKIARKYACTELRETWHLNCMCGSCGANSIHSEQSWERKMSHHFHPIRKRIK